MTSDITKDGFLQWNLELDCHKATEAEIEEYEKRNDVERTLMGRIKNVFNTIKAVLR